MGIDQLPSLLARHDCIALDTSIFIYQLQAHPRYLPATDSLFSWLQRQGHSAVTSTITMTELLVHPYRASDDRMVDQFFALLSRYPNLHWIAPGLGIADRAARIRALHNLRTPDALQAATALDAGATALFSNDPVFHRLRDIEVVVIEDFL